MQCTKRLLPADSAFVIFPKSGKRILSYLSDELRPRRYRICRGKGGDWVFCWTASRPTAHGAIRIIPGQRGCNCSMLHGGFDGRGKSAESGAAREEKRLDKGLEFLLSSFKDGGVCSSVKTEGYGAMYGHALAMAALLEVNGNMPWHPELEDRVSKGLQAIFSYQRPDGGWRYQRSSAR